MAEEKKEQPRKEHKSEKFAQGPQPPPKKQSKPEPGSGGKKNGE